MGIWPRWVRDVWVIVGMEVARETMKGLQSGRASLLKGGGGVRQAAEQGGAWAQRGGGRKQWVQPTREPASRTTAATPGSSMRVRRRHADPTTPAWGVQQQQQQPSTRSALAAPCNQQPNNSPHFGAAPGHTHTLQAPRTANRVDPTRRICLSERLSHASLV